MFNTVYDKLKEVFGVVYLSDANKNSINLQVKYNGSIHNITVHKPIRQEQVNAVIKNITQR